MSGTRYENEKGGYMTLEKAIKLLEEEYGKAKMLNHVKNPTAYALYKTWQKADASQKKEMKKFKIKTTKSFTITQQDIDDIMTTALEGGITYWCCKAEVVGDYLGEYASDQISRGGALILTDNEDDKKYELTLEKFLKGFQKYMEDGGISEAVDENGEIEIANIDACAADTIIQYALFDKLVFG